MRLPIPSCSLYCGWESASIDLRDGDTSESCSTRWRLAIWHYGDDKSQLAQENASLLSFKEWNSELGSICASDADYKRGLGGKAVCCRKVKLLDGPYIGNAVEQ